MCGSNFINQMLDSKYVQPNDLLLLRKTECNLKILNGSSTHFNTSSLPRMKKSTFMNRNDELIQLQGVLALCDFWDLEKFALGINHSSQIFILWTQ